MANPYQSKGPAQFWRLGVADVPCEAVTPLPAKRFAFEASAVVSTAGSCFAQNVAQYLRGIEEVRLLEAEPVSADQPLFSALYGNIYTARHLLQLMQRAFGTFHPQETAWRRADGRYVDPFRPYVFRDGFATANDVEEARALHLAAVRRVFTDCSVFIFTLGLTEAWISPRDGSVFPVAPGVATDAATATPCEFHNFSYAEVLDDVVRFLSEFRGVNPAGRVILTVSPVPLTATYTDEHVLVATMHSKSILRAVCSEVAARCDFAYYFPSFEVIAGHFTRGAYYHDNLRTVSSEGIAHVMRVFRATYLERREAAGAVAASPRDALGQNEDDVICDEEEIVRTMGFEGSA